MQTLPEQKLVVWLDKEIKKQAYGQFSLTLLVKDGQPVLETAKLVKMKRKKYKLPTAWQHTSTSVYVVLSKQSHIRMRRYPKFGWRFFLLV